MIENMKNLKVWIILKNRIEKMKAKTIDN